MVRWLAAFLVGLLISTKAGAQTPAPARGVLVSFRAEPANATLRIQGPGIAANAGSCPADCVHRIAPGHYTVYYSPAGGKTTPLDVDVREPSEVVVSSDSFQRGFGLALIIGGGAVAAAGAFAFYYDWKSQFDEDRFGDVDPSYDYSTPDWVLPMEIAGGVGLGVATVGMILFLTAPPSVEVLPRRTATVRHRTIATSRSRFELVPALGPRAGGARFAWSF